MVMTRKDGATTTATGSASRAALVTELIRELTRRERLVLALRYTEELTVTEIAAVMEIAATEVERMLDSISERVRRRLAPIYGRPLTRRA
jgi:DNA-directed RNA polymerase specialized sigma subunit